MQDRQELFRSIPKVDELLKQQKIAELTDTMPYSVVLEGVRQVLDQIRRDIIDGRLDRVDFDAVQSRILEQCARDYQRSLRRVVNATGTVLHTNLGRAPLAKSAVDAVCDVASGYSTLEYDVQTGTRGLRYSHVTQLLKTLTGAEDALVVNNNAAAVVLILSALTKGKEVVLSRGELVEIGGSFRVPEIMEQSGSVLKEVGTTNKTHLSDYQNAVTEDTAALMKVHTSNFKIMGFTEDVSLEDLVALGREKGLMVLHDLGSGALFDPQSEGLFSEPTVKQSIDAGVDVVSFSGDKLLGGPQAGIILGKREYIQRIQRHPLTRAFRIDKLTLAALEATLRLYLDPDQALAEVPVLSMLVASPETLRDKAERLFQKVSGIPHLDIQIVQEDGQVGGGSAPAERLPGYALAVTSEELSPDQIERRMRVQEVPVIGRIAHDQYLLNLRTISDEEMDVVASALKQIVKD